MNTIIIFTSAPYVKANDHSPLQHTVKFVMFKKPFAVAATKDNLLAIDRAGCTVFDKDLTELVDNVQNHDDFRIFPIRQSDLFNDGAREDGGLKIYEGNKWGGKFLRAPDIFFTILKKGKGKLVRLGEVAEILPGCYSGVNDFFYLDEDTVNEWKIEKQFLKPIVRNTNNINSLYFSGNTGYYVFSCNFEKSKLPTNTKKYINWGEKQVTRKRQKTSAGIPWPKTETVKRRKPGWWAIPKNNLIESNLFMTYVVNDRFYCPITDFPIVSDRCYHRIFFNNPILLSAFLNSTLTSFFVNLLGRGNLGQGALKFETHDAKNLYVFYDDKLSSIADKIKILGQRIPKSIFEELGFDRDLPIRSQQPNPLPDRKALDDVVFDALGLTEEERKEVYWAVAELVKNRLDKARSV